MTEEMRRKLTLLPSIFDDALARYVSEVSESLQVSSDMTCAVVLASMAAVAQDRLRIQVRTGWIEPVNLYILGVAAPGDRKSPLVNKVSKPVTDLNEERKALVRDEVILARGKREELLSELATAKRKGKGVGEAYAALERFQLPPNASLLAPSDITPESLVEALARSGGALAILDAEGDILQTGLRYQNVPNLALLKKAWSGERYEMARRRDGGERYLIAEPRLTLGILTQLDAVKRWVEQPGVEGEGLFARFLVFYPFSLMGTRKMDTPEISKETEDDYEQCLRRLDALPKSGTTLKLSTQAQQVLMRWQEALEKRLAPHGDLVECSGWASKLTGNLMRIAALLHASESESLEVSTHTLARVLDIGDRLIFHQQRLLKAIYQPPEESLRASILELAQRFGSRGFTLRDTTKSGRRVLQDRVAVEAVLQAMVDDGELRKLLGQGPGRPTCRFLLQTSPQNPQNPG